MPASEDQLAHARDLIAHYPLVDGHNDLPWVIRESGIAQSDVIAARLSEDLPKRDTDIPKLRAGGVSAQFWAAFIPTATPHPLRTTLEQIDLIHRMNEAHADVFLPARSAADINRAKAEGKIASFVAVEGGVALEDSLEILSIFHRLGARYLTLCHNETLNWVDSTTDVKRHGGLTDFGRRVIAEMNRLGLMVDLSHTSHDAMRAVLDVTEAPVLFTHCNAYSLCDHPRNVPDDVLDRIPANGGIIMATFVPDFISQASRNWMRPMKDEFGKTLRNVDWKTAMPARAAELGPWPRASLADLADHIDYLAARVGSDHVGIGSDFFGGPTPRGLEDASKFPDLIAELVARGWTDDALVKIMGANFIRVFEANEAVARVLQNNRKPAIGRLEP
jgi:membrane dipeptidase